MSGFLLQHPLVTKAFEYASKWQNGQKRGSTYKSQIPTVSHSIRVAEVLQQTVDYDPVLVASGVAHDTVEDKTGATFEGMREDISDEVASVVEEVNLDTDIKGKVRRDLQIAAIAGMSLNGRRLKVADRCVNLINLAFDPPANWTLENKINYLMSSRQLIEQAAIPDLKLQVFSQEALALAERAVLVGVRERLLEKGPKFKGVENDISAIIEKAYGDVNLMASLYDEKGNPIQRHGSLDALYEEATFAQKEISMLVRHIADMNGYTAILPNQLKGRERAEEVVESRMNGDPRYINDIARVSLVCKSMEDINYVLHMISQSYKNVVIYNRFENPPATGYRDMKLVVRTDKSHFAEIQLHLESYWNAKKHRGDDIYHEIRALGCKSNEDLTPEEKKHRRALYEETRQLYKEAGLPHGFVTPKTFGACPRITYSEYLANHPPSPALTM